MGSSSGFCGHKFNHSVNVSHCKYRQVNICLLVSFIFADLKKMVGNRSILTLSLGGGVGENCNFLRLLISN